MASIKQRLLLLIVAIAVIVATVNATSLVVGKRQPKDGLVCFGDVNLRAQVGKVLSTQKVCNVPRWNQTITQISALDLGIKGRGGYAEIVKGGVGYKNVTLHLWSQKSQPLNFTIRVYAKPFW